MSEAERGEKVATFLAVAGCDDAVALSYLEANNWDLDRAINTFLAAGDAAAVPAAAGGVGNAATDDMDAATARAIAELDDSMMAGDMEEVVRAPIPQRVHKLVDVPSHHAANVQPIPGAVPGLPSGPVVHKQEAFRDFEQEANDLQERASAAEDPVDRAKKPKNLADIYRAPTELCFPSGFDELRAAGQEQGRWLLVNIQSPIEFASQQLNADTWRDEALRAVIGAHFLFWQQYHDSQHGSRYVSYYLRNSQQLPHIGVLDPRTGELCKAMTGFVTAERLLDLLMTYADKDLQPMPSINALPAHSPVRAGAASAMPAHAAPGLAATDAAASPPGRTLGSGSAPSGAEPAPSDPAADDAFWAERAPGPEPAGAGPGCVRLALRLPDGSRSAPRIFEVSTPMGAVLAHVHASGHRLSSARAWKLVQTIPKGELRGFDSPLSGLLDSGSAILLLAEDDA